MNSNAGKEEEGSGGGLTVGDVGRSGEAVVHEHAVGLGHLEVDHVRGVLQRRDRVLVAHLF